MADARETLARWMIARGYATGHGDSVEDLLRTLDWQIAERIGEASKDTVELLKLLDLYARTNESQSQRVMALASKLGAAEQALRTTLDHLLDNQHDEALGTLHDALEELGK